jgi:hypothetical protein
LHERAYGQKLGTWNLGEDLSRNGLENGWNGILEGGGNGLKWSLAEKRKAGFLRPFRLKIKTD